MARRPRPKPVKLSDAAAARVKEIMEERGAGYLRVGVKNGGCAGMEYVMDYAMAPEPLDEVVEDNGVTILIDAKAVLFLLGSDAARSFSAKANRLASTDPSRRD